jgi:5-(carboxyamino)imidazole ribonucleotide synthase
MSAPALAPGAVIGMLGGGQLGRMTALAAARLGYRTHLFGPDIDGPLAQVTDRATFASYGDRAALDAFAARVDVVTYEFENVPHAAVAHLAAMVPVRPGPQALATCQDRVAEKAFANGLGIGTAPWQAVDDRPGLDAAVAAVGRPAVLKTRREGYDGKGQATIRTPGDLDRAWAAIGGRPAILEGFVDFARELSVIAARGADGTIVCYPAVENRHRDHILAETIAPAPSLDAARTAEAETIATRLAEALGIVGLLAVELFETRDGRLLVNELAPRPHNSGHWTMDACATDQFEQLVRAVCGLPLGTVDRHSDCVMTNLIGADVEEVPAILAEPGARLHLYGKAETRPGRKMGHVNRLRRRS